MGPLPRETTSGEPALSGIPSGQLQRPLSVSLWFPFTHRLPSRAKGPRTTPLVSLFSLLHPHYSSQETILFKSQRAHWLRNHCPPPSVHALPPQVHRSLTISSEELSTNPWPCGTLTTEKASYLLQDWHEIMNVKCLSKCKMLCESWV